jgi:hypothetical protein
MVNSRWLKIKYFHTLGDLEPKQLKVATLKLFHPTASLHFRKGLFSIATQFLGGEG